MAVEQGQQRKRGADDVTLESSDALSPYVAQVNILADRARFERDNFEVAAKRLKEVESTLMNVGAKNVVLTSEYNRA